MKSVNDWIQQALNAPNDFTWDGQIVSVFEAYIHVRLKGGNRRLITHVIIADHIDRDKLKPGRYCKISRLHDRGEGQTGRFIVTDILPIPSQDGVVIETPAKPEVPRMTAKLDCTESAWYLSWTEATNALSYNVYAAQNEDGLNEKLLVETTNLDYALPFVVDGFAFFAVEAVGASGNSAYSEWTTDSKYFQDTGVVTFGDDYNHGSTVDSERRFRAKDGAVEKTVNYGASFYDVTPQGVSNDWPGESFTMDEVKYIQVEGATALSIVLGHWDNLSGETKGWWWSSTDLGETWTVRSLNPDGATEVLPLWGAVGFGKVAITVWQDGTMYLKHWDDTDLGIAPTEIALGTTTKQEAIDGSKKAFPVLEAGKVFVSGLFTNPDTTNDAHVSIYDFIADAWTDIVNDWGADVATGFTVEVDGTDELYYAVRETPA